MDQSKKSDFYTATGIIIILIGIITNKWLLAALLSPDGRIESGLFNVIIPVFNVSLIVLGVRIIKRDRERLKTELTNAAILTASLSLCVLGLEVFLRVYPVSVIKEPKDLGLFIDNPNGTGSYRLKPNSNFTTRVGNTDVSISTNSHGMRWRKVSHANPSNKKRIAFVGDSQTFGLWADTTENTFVGIFDSLIDAQRYEVLNFGVGGYGLWDIKLQVIEEVLPFKPEFLFLMFFNGNDFRDTFLSTSKYKIIDGVAKVNSSHYDKLIPSAYRENEGQEGGRYSKMLESSRVYRFFTGAVGHLWQEEQPDFIVSKNFRSFTFWSQTNYPEIATKAVQETLKVLDEIGEVCREHGIRLVIVTIPFMEQVYAREVSGDSYNILLPQSYIAEFVKKRSIPYLDLLPVLRSHVREAGAKIYVGRDPHFNNKGHLITGKTLASYFQDQIEKGR